MPDNNALHRIRGQGGVRHGVEPVLGCLELDVTCREFGKHLSNIWVMVEPTHVGIAAEASLVGQKHEGGNWFGGLEGG
eukprot:108561-Pelagomonas_calceolata.AAC.1